jgi:hypothetical protein
MKQNNNEQIVINLDSLYHQTAKLEKLTDYEREVLDLVGEGVDVVLTGPAPVWLYLRLAHALHGKARKLIYNSPVTGDVEIFNHDPF